MYISGFHWKLLTLSPKTIVLIGVIKPYHGLTVHSVPVTARVDTTFIMMHNNYVLSQPHKIMKLKGQRDNYPFNHSDVFMQGRKIDFPMMHWSFTCNKEVSLKFEVCMLISCNYFALCHFATFLYNIYMVNVFFIWYKTMLVIIFIIFHRESGWS